MKNPDSAGSVWLVRHGESTWNASGLVQGQAEGPVLSPEGRSQAALVARRLNGVPFGAVISSDLERARETADIIVDEIGLDCRRIEDTAIRERHFGAAQGMPFSTLGPAWSGIEGGRVVDTEARPPGGESLTALYERVREFLLECVQRARDSDVLVVTHGGVIRVAQAALQGVSLRNMEWTAVPNASAWVFDLQTTSPTTLRQQPPTEARRMT